MVQAGTKRFMRVRTMRQFLRSRATNQARVDPRLSVISTLHEGVTKDWGRGRVQGRKEQWLSESRSVDGVNDKAQVRMPDRKAQCSGTTGRGWHESADQQGEQGACVRVSWVGHHDAREVDKQIESLCQRTRAHSRSVWMFCHHHPHVHLSRFRVLAEPNDAALLFNHQDA